MCLRCKILFRDGFELGDARSVKIPDDFLANFQANIWPLMTGTPTVFEPIDFVRGDLRSRHVTSDAADKCSAMLVLQRVMARAGCSVIVSGCLVYEYL